MKRRGNQSQKSNRQQHAHAYKHAKAILSPIGATEDATNTERRRSGRRFRVTFNSQAGEELYFTFHLDPMFRISTGSSFPAHGRLAGCSDLNVVKRQATLLAIIRENLHGIIDFRGFTLLTAALSYDPFAPAATR
jgi:hypothetical protein